MPPPPQEAPQAGPDAMLGELGKMAEAASKSNPQAAEMFAQALSLIEQGMSVMAGGEGPQEEPMPSQMPMEAGVRKVKPIL
jgi:hypothetical protein